MKDLTKLRRTAMTLSCVVSLMILLVLIQNTMMLVHSEPVSWTPTAIITLVIGWIIVLATMAISLSLLFTIKRNETPFSRTVVKRLKSLALLLIAYEPVTLIGSRIIRFDLPVFEGYIDGAYTMITTVPSFVGFIMAAGLVVYCVAHIFDYGLFLQQQVDETL